MKTGWSKKADAKFAVKGAGNSPDNSLILAL